MKHIHRWRLVAGAVAVLVLVVGASRPPAALAHTRIEVGPYVLIIGWANEPTIVGERNAIVVEVTEDEAPVTGLEATLKLEVLYAGRTYRGNLAPAGEPGWYSAEIFPTVRGQYQVRLFGTIEDLALDETVEPEEVLGPEVLQFPEAQPDPRALQAAVDDLEARLATALTLAVGGLTVGLLGLGLGAFSLFRRR